MKLTKLSLGSQSDDGDDYDHEVLLVAAISMTARSATLVPHRCCKSHKLMQAKPLTQQIIRSTINFLIHTKVTTKNFIFTALLNPSVLLR